MHYFNLIYSGAAAVALNVYTSLFYGKSKERVSIPMINKVIIVTGANTGIGKEIASKLYISGAKVIMACRDETRANEALQKIKENACKLPPSPTKMLGDIMFMHLDLSDLQSIPRFVDKFYETYSSFDVLINNAGLNTKGVTKNGLQQLFQVNYLGHYLLTRLLIQRNGQNNSKQCSTNDNTNNDGICNNDGDNNAIKKKKVRIVNLSSVTHHFGGNDFKTSAFSLSPSTNSYSDSKLYMNYLTYQLNKLYSHHDHHFHTNDSVSSNYHDPDSNNLNNYQINDSSDDSSNNNNKSINQHNQFNVLAVSVNPGGVRSDIFRHWKGIKRVILDIIFGLFLDVDEGSETAVYAACASENEILEKKSLYSLISSSLLSSHITSTDHAKVTPAGTTDNNSISLVQDIIDFNKTPMKMIGDDLIPYVIPYNMPRHTTSSSQHQWLSITKNFLFGSPSFCFELLGVFAGTIFSPCNVPVLSSAIVNSENKNGMIIAKNVALDTVSSSLWKFSEDLCVLKLSEESFKLQLEI